MSQDLKSGTPDGNHEDDLPLSPGDPGRVRARSPEPEVVISAAEAERTEPWPVSPEKRTGRSDISAHASTNDSGNGNSYSAGRTPQPQAALAAWPVGSTTAVDSNGFSADAPSQEHEDEILMGSEEELLGEPEATLAESEEPIAAHPERSRLKLRFQRADLYLGLAILVAALALLWPTGSSHAPKLPMWERILIAVGIAEEPPTVTHFHGDPDLKVWVDTHTALYYCPGDDLYGKSPGGHYSTQRDAQSDRFEPAERSVCVE